MLSTFAVTVPFFALVLLGYLAARQGMLSDDAIPGLNVFVLYFALPSALFRLGTNTPLLQLLSLGILAIYSLCALLMIGHHRTDVARLGEPEGCGVRGAGRCLSQYWVHGAAVGGNTGWPSGCGHDDLDHRRRHRPDEFCMHRACAMAGGVQARAPRRYRYGIARRGVKSVALGHRAWGRKLGYRSEASRSDRRNRSHACRCSYARRTLHHRGRAVACQ